MQQTASRATKSKLCSKSCRGSATRGKVNHTRKVTHTHTRIYTHAHACTTHAHTSHHITSHHITSHHITSRHVTSQQPVNTERSNTVRHGTTLHTTPHEHKSRHNVTQTCCCSSSKSCSRAVSLASLPTSPCARRHSRCHNEHATSHRTVCGRWSDRKAINSFWLPTSIAASLCVYVCVCGQ
jgi:hypothetical protein